MCNSKELLFGTQTLAFCVMFGVQATDFPRSNSLRLSERVLASGEKHQNMEEASNDSIGPLSIRPRHALIQAGMPAQGMQSIFDKTLQMHPVKHSPRLVIYVRVHPFDMGLFGIAYFKIATHGRRFQRRNAATFYQFLGQSCHESFITKFG